MKKILSILSLVVILGFAAPAMASPNGSHGRSYGPPHGGHSVHYMGRKPAMYAPQPPMPMHKFPVYTVGYARRGYWGVQPHCNYTLRYVNGYYPVPYYPESYYRSGIYFGVGVPLF